MQSLQVCAAYPTGLRATVSPASGEVVEKLAHTNRATCSDSRHEVSPGISGKALHSGTNETDNKCPYYTSNKSSRSIFRRACANKGLTTYKADKQTCKKTKEEADDDSNNTPHN